MVKNYDKIKSKKYRNIDHCAVNKPIHKFIASKLSTLCDEVNANSTGLDIACGTGRYFYLLENINTLYALDSSIDMLNLAKNPVFSDRVNIDNIIYIHSSIESFQSNQKFDLIYSIGLLGQYKVLDIKFLNSIHKKLNTGCKFFFTVVDRKSFLKQKKDKLSLFSFLKFKIKNLIKPNYAIKKDRLISILKKSDFSTYTIETCENEVLSKQRFHYFVTLYKAEG